MVFGIVLDADGQDERQSDVGCVGGSVAASSDRPADRSALASAASSEDDGRGCGCRGLGREPADSPPYRVSRALCFTCYLNKNCARRARFLRFVLSKKWRRKDGNGVSVSSRNSVSVTGKRIGGFRGERITELFTHFPAVFKLQTSPCVSLKNTRWISNWTTACGNRWFVGFVASKISGCCVWQWRRQPCFGGRLQQRQSRPAARNVLLRKTKQKKRISLNRRSVVVGVFCVKLTQTGGGVVKQHFFSPPFNASRMKLPHTRQYSLSFLAGVGRPLAPPSGAPVVSQKIKVTRWAVTGNDKNVRQRYASRDVKYQRWVEILFDLLFVSRLTSGDSIKHLSACACSSAVRKRLFDFLFFFLFFKIRIVQESSGLIVSARQRACVFALAARVWKAQVVICACDAWRRRVT